MLLRGRAIDFTNDQLIGFFSEKKILWELDVIIYIFTLEPYSGRYKYCITEIYYTDPNTLTNVHHILYHEEESPRQQKAVRLCVGEDSLIISNMVSN